MRQVADMRKAILLVVVIVTAVSSVAYAEVRKEYYESGQLMGEIERRGTLEIHKHYYKSGGLREEWQHKYGKQDGIHKFYYESGQLKTEANYKDGKLEGTSRVYDESGQLRVEAYFMNGEMISQKKYDSDGNLESEQEYPTK